AHLKRRREELGVTERVVFAGRRNDVPAILRVGHVLVLPSDQEGLPGVVLEAMASGLPVVVTPAAAAPVVEGVTGWIVPPHDPQRLAEAVIKLLENPAQAAAMGRAARQQVVQRYSLEA
ncbi:MAG: glycosyltransferase family 4 protein, partial [Candidatus Zipacnadales bacterium]